MNPSIGLIMQARMGSTRLPGKVLATIGGRCLLGHALSRVSGLPDTRVVIATTDTLRDDIVEAFCREQGIDCFRGSEDNVLERYVYCAEAWGFEHVVRLTGDNPFPDRDALVRLIQRHLGSKADFCTSFEGLPVGVGCEIFTAGALRLSLNRADQPHHFEHVDEYLLEHLDTIRHQVLPPPRDLCAPDVRLTVDTAEDLERVRTLVARGGDDISTQEAIRLCRSLW